MHRCSAIVMQVVKMHIAVYASCMYGCMCEGAFRLPLPDVQLQVELFSARQQCRPGSRGGYRVHNRASACMSYIACASVSGRPACTVCCCICDVCYTSSTHIHTRRYQPVEDRHARCEPLLMGHHVEADGGAAISRGLDGSSGSHRAGIYTHDGVREDQDHRHNTHANHIYALYVVVLYIECVAMRTSYCMFTSQDRIHDRCR